MTVHVEVRGEAGAHAETCEQCKGSLEVAAAILAAIEQHAADVAGATPTGDLRSDYKDVPMPRRKPTDEEILATARRFRDGVDIDDLLSAIDRRYGVVLDWKDVDRLLEHHGWEWREVGR